MLRPRNPDDNAKAARPPTHGLRRGLRWPTKPCRRTRQLSCSANATTSDGDGQTISITAEPGKTVWLEENVSTATITGDFTFDVNGTRYEVDNVTFTQPASPVTGTKAAAA